MGDPGKGLCGTTVTPIMQTLRGTCSCLDQTGEGFLLVFHFKHHLLPVGPYGHQGKASDALAEPLDIVVVIDVLCNCLRALGELLRSLFPCRAPVLQERPSHLRKPR